MKNNLLKIVIPVVILVLISTIYITRPNFTKGTTIDMQGKDDNFSQSGIYKDSFNSIKDLEKSYKDISVSVTFNEQSFQIPLTSIKILE